MKFIDEFNITIKSGKGGAGCVSFHHEKYNDHAGPDGGDGGKGGDVYIEANPGIQTLGHLMKKTNYYARNGDPGRGSNCSGKNAEDLIIQVPVGTQAVNKETGDVLADMVRHGTRVKVAIGGKGGQGNQHFATSVNQAPEHAQPGMPGEYLEVHLELKLLADVGLIGLPNAGKSTILAALSRNKPKIADYPFTTLTPNLGVIENEALRRFQIADIPGIIEGASKGAGLGLSFLRHIERVPMIVYVVDIGSSDPAQDISLLQAELNSYSSELLNRPALLVLNKLDLVDFDMAFAEETAKTLLAPEIWSESAAVPEIMYLSSGEKWGLETFVNKIFEMLPDATFAEKQL